MKEGKVLEFWNYLNLQPQRFPEPLASPAGPVTRPDLSCGSGRTRPRFPTRSLLDPRKLKSAKMCGGGTMRICSLLPSITEILFELELGDSIVGVTHECD